MHGFAGVGMGEKCAPSGASAKILQMVHRDLLIGIDFSWSKNAIVTQKLA